MITSVPCAARVLLHVMGIPSRSEAEEVDGILSLTYMDMDMDMDMDVASA